MPEAYYYANGAYLGKSTLPQELTTQSNHLWTCSTCGEPWGRVVVEGSNYWEQHNAPCELHKPTGVPDWGTHPGSLLNRMVSVTFVPYPSQATCIEYLPPAALSREMLLLLKETENVE